MLEGDVRPGHSRLLTPESSEDPSEAGERNRTGHGNAPPYRAAERFGPGNLRSEQPLGSIYTLQPASPQAMRGGSVPGTQA